MNIQGWAEIALTLGLSITIGWPLGLYLSRVWNGEGGEGQEGQAADTHKNHVGHAEVSGLSSSPACRKRRRKRAMRVRARDVRET